MSTETSLEDKKVDQVIDVQPVPSPAVTKIGSDEFVKEISKLLNDKKIYWRSSKSLAEKIGVDTIDLDKWLRKQPKVTSRASSTEGVFYYALLERIENPAAKKQNDKVKKVMSRPVTTEEDRYATALLHQTFGNLNSILAKYAMLISGRSMEGFQALVAARDRMEAGITLYTGLVKADMNKLPK